MFKYQFHVVDQYGNVKAGAYVKVTDPDTGEYVSIYSDNSSTPLANPFAADADGYAAFWVPFGTYDVLAYTTGYSRLWTDVTIGGDKGDKGDTGDKGDKGDQGIPGEPGVAIAPAYSAVDVLRGNEGFAAHAASRSAVVNDYSGVLLDAGELDDLVTLTRASDATYFDRDGLLKTASSNVLRYCYDPVTRKPRGLLVEGAATNLLLQSRFAAAWAGQRGTLTPNSATGKDGTTGAATFTPNTDNNTHYIPQTSVSITSGKTYCKSVFAKAGNGSGAGRCIRLVTDNSPSWSVLGVATFDLVAGTVVDGSGTYGMEDLGDGWYLCWVVGVASTTTSLVQSFFTVQDESHPTTVIFAANGTDYIYIDEAQFEEGTQPSSRIRTTTATATRSADSLTIGPNTFPVLANGECTLYWRGRVRGASSVNFSNLLTAKDSGSNERFIIEEAVPQGGIRPVVVDDGSTIGNAGAFALTLGADLAAGASLRPDILRAYANGSQFGTDSTVSVPTIDRLIVSPIAGSIYEIEEFAYIARALSAAELAAWTTV
jgi:hypothetical protein